MLYFFINFWCNKSTLLKKIDIVDESIINVYSMTSYIKWTRVMQLTQRVKTYRDAKFNQTINL